MTRRTRAASAAGGGEAAAAPAPAPARTAIRLASLLRGGVPVQRAFAVLAREPAAGEEVRGIAAAIERGTGTAAALAAAPDPGWRVLAAAWHLAEESGAAFAPALEAIGAGLERLAEVRGRRDVLLAGPRATMRTVVALPPLALALGWLMGFDPLAVLVGPLGAPLLAAGVGLLVGGWSWARRMIGAEVGRDRVGGLEFELARIAVGGGAPHDLARRRIADAVDRAGAEWIPFDALRDASPLAGVLASAAVTGAPIGPLLASEAQAHRAAASVELERAAERLGVRILIPIATCVLPSFVILGVAPVVVSMFTGF